MKLSKLGTWAVLLGFSLPVWAAQPGAISGYVRNASGVPQMGAIVEILGAANQSLIVFTDAAGYYTAANLLPGFYSLKVSAPSFLPAMREKIGLRPGANVNINVTLSTLLGVMQLGPVRSLSDDDDWKWTLRSVANRPILRVFDDPVIPVEKEPRPVTGNVTFFAGSAASGYGSGSDMSTGFRLDRSLFADANISVSGNVADAGGVPAAVVRTTYTHHRPDGSRPSYGFTARRFAPSDPNLHNAALQSLAFSAGDEFALGDTLELKFGSTMQTIQFLGHLSSVRPHFSIVAHASPTTVLEYSYTTSRPDLRAEKGFDSAPADFSETDPRVSLTNFNPQLESAHHEEFSVSQRIGGTNFQFAAFSDHIHNTALTGAGVVTSSGGFLLPDMASGTFTYAGPDLNTGGMRLVLQHKFAADLTATLDYAYGGALALTSPGASLDQAQQSISTLRRHALAAKLAGTAPRTHTHWIASYRWVNGTGITPVDMFNSSPGQNDAYLNLFIRQPIPALGGHMEALIDIRNLLAQGYVPVLGQDGQTVYLVDSARSIRGGVAFNF